MRKITTIFFAQFLLSSCGKYDDSAVRSDIKELESRVAALEQQCRLLNVNISALPALVVAVQGRDCVVSVTDLKASQNLFCVHKVRLLIEHKECLVLKVTENMYIRNILHLCQSMKACNE